MEKFSCKNQYGIVVIVADEEEEEEEQKKVYERLSRMYDFEGKDK